MKSSEKIFLPHGKFALVDTKLYTYLNKWKWHADSITGYAVRNIHPVGKIYMHRLVVASENIIPREKQVDHINRNKLDNRISNLRIVTPSQNIRNSGLRKTNKSGTKGVTWNKQHKMWEAHLTLNYKKVHLGLFHDLQDAKNARRDGERRYWP